MSGDAAEDFFEMSDEDLLKLDPESLEGAATTALSGAGDSEEEESETVDEQVTDDSDPSDEEIEGAADEEEEETTSEEDEEETSDDDGGEESTAEGQVDDEDAEESESGENPDSEEDTEQETDDNEDEDGEVPTPAEANQAFVDRILAPFPANGKQMQVTNADDAIKLMQMGANYNKKMSALKPHLKMIKMLENNELLEEGKLSFLIDLSKKDPAAIQKLVKESGMDPLEMDQKESEYKPGTYTVDDREIELDSVLDTIQDTPTYQQTIDLVVNKWDGPSKQTIANQPNLLELINNQVASGVFEIVSTEMERERALGRLSGLSDLEAYKATGDAIHKRGGFDHLGSDEPAAPTPKTPPAGREVKPKAKAKKNPARDSKRRAASPTKTKSSETKKPTDFNPLELSDEEFEQQIDMRLL
jgi:hypothetical protein